jgi:hypothetical protein
MRVINPAQLILLNLISLFTSGKEQACLQIIKLFIAQSFPASCYFVPLWSNCSPPHLFSYTLNVLGCSSLNVRDQVSQPYKTTRKIMVLYILILTFVDIIEYAVASVPQILSGLNFFMNAILICYCLSHTYSRRLIFEGFTF